MLQASALPYPKGLQIVIEKEGTEPYKVLVNKEVVATFEGKIFLLPFPISKGLQGVTIEIEDDSGQRTQVFPGKFSLQPYEIGFIQTILQKQENVIRQHGGFLVRVFKRRRNGEPCPRCLKSVGHEPLFEELKTEQALQVDPNCTVCFGTGYKGGYYKPIETWANYYQPQQVQADVFDTIRFEQTMLVLGNYPLLERDDVIVAPTLGRVFRVSSVQGSEYKGVVVNQLVQAQSVEAGSVLYKLVGIQYLDLSDTFQDSYSETFARGN